MLGSFPGSWHQHNLVQMMDGPVQITSFSTDTEENKEKHENISSSHASIWQLHKQGCESVRLIKLCFLLSSPVHVLVTAHDPAAPD